MACPMCIRDKGNKDKLEKEQQKRQEDDQKKREENEVIVTKGDPEVESAYREKQQEIEKEREKALKVKKLDENKVKYTCQKCHYEFIYKLDKNSPSNCPYCGEKVQSFVVE